MNCPSCGAPMTARTVDGHLGRTVDIDVCPACHVFWFDQHESLQLSPAGTLALFTVIGSEVSATRQAVNPVTKCPRCNSQLVPTHDMQRNVGFQYRRCPHGHGRLTTWFDFLREKNFIRPLSPNQIADLRQNVTSVNCSNCGAPVDLTHTSTCAHCGSPLSVLDLHQAGELVAELQRAAAVRGEIDPDLPLRLERARREVEIAFATAIRPSRGSSPSAETDLVGAGLALLARWLQP